MPYKKKVKVKSEKENTINQIEADQEISEKEDRAQKVAKKLLEGFPIVGIGASAGGLAAFEAFFSGMPDKEDPGMAFVLVQHLAPDYKSILTDLIQRYTRMKVFEVEDGMVVRPNCVYIIPPNKDMTFLKGALLLQVPIAPRGHRMPIDFFFNSLVQDQHARAICIILSGSGSDGTLGLRAIKGEGGMAMVQTPSTAEYDGMPTSAIATGLADYELSPIDMPASLISYTHHAFGKFSRNISPAPKSEISLKKVFILLRNQCGHDFSQYKSSTINRRIERRMAVHQIKTLDEYIKFLQIEPTEGEALFNDMLIGVTSFFRDPQVFKIIEKQIIPRLMESKPSQSIIRIWTAGCSTGEEAYSIAILLTEAMETLMKNFQIQIFATDIDKNAIAKARGGMFSLSIAADMTPERLERFFTLEKGFGYHVKKTLRDMIVFSEQDIIKDPPFSKVDLISCRNVLIYLGPQLQKKLIPLFHYSLNKEGYLFLGTAETTGDFDNLFDSIDHKSKIYQAKVNTLNSKQNLFNTFKPLETATETAISEIEIEAVTKSTGYRELTEKTILLNMLQTAILIDGSGNILYFHGRTGKYLEPAPGEAGVNNIIRMAREGLQSELTTALHKVFTSKMSINHPNIRVKTNGDYELVNLSIYPVVDDLELLETTNISPRIKDQLYVVALEHSQSISTNTNGIESIIEELDTDPKIAILKKKLEAQEEYIHAAKEELETSNEELKSSNEEMQSVNEELQSTNEELETSKEELQSVNEELSTVNTELQSKVNDLSKVNNDMNNLLSGTGIGTVFVDYDLRIIRFTPTITKIINLIKEDIGRSIGHIVSNLVGYTTLISDTQMVLDTLIPKELEVVTNTRRSYNMNILPYRTTDNVIEGAVITFTDITEQKRLEDVLKATQIQMAEAIVGTVREPLLVLDSQLRVVLANRSFYSTFKVEPEATIGEFLYDLGNKQWEIPALRKLLEEILPENSVFNDYEMTHKFQTIGKRTMLINARRVFSELNQFELILLAIEDITARKG